jgi:hypothetical protein
MVRHRAGTFVLGYSAYRVGNVSMCERGDHAHDGLLELAAEMGLPIVGSNIVTSVVIFAVLATGIYARQRGVIVPTAAISVAILAGVHLPIDFSLQNPGYSMIAFSLMGVGLVQSCATRNTEGSTQDGVRSAAR